MIYPYFIFQNFFIRIQLLKDNLAFCLHFLRIVQLWELVLLFHTTGQLTVIKILLLLRKPMLNENVLFLNEYRQAFRNGFLTLDTSYTEGYKNTSSTKTGGSRNHIFADLILDLNQDDIVSK